MANAFIYFRKFCFSVLWIAKNSTIGKEELLQFRYARQLDQVSLPLNYITVNIVNRLKPEWGRQIYLLAMKKILQSRNFAFLKPFL